MAPLTLASVVCTALITALGYGIYRGYTVRSRINKLRKAGLVGLSIFVDHVVLMEI